MWNDLTMNQKAEVISYAVKAGMRDIDSIRSFYNESVGSSREYKKGGYLDWKKEASKCKHLDIDNDNTYDYEGWYNENPERAWNLLKDDPNAHFDDRYKTVYHPTFSTQSKYSGVRDVRFNPQGLIGGTWSKDNHTFTMSPDGYRGPVSMDERRAYLEDAEDYGVQLREADGSLPIYDNTIWGGVLPSITIRPRRFGDGGKKSTPRTTEKPIDGTTGAARHINKETQKAYNFISSRGLPVHRDAEFNYGKYLDALSDYGGKGWSLYDMVDDAVDLYSVGSKVTPSTQFYFEPFKP